MFQTRGISRWVTTLLLSGSLATMGCGDDNPAASGSGSVPDHAGANTPITSGNAQVVMTTAMGTMLGTLGQVLSAAASAKQSVAAAKTVANLVVNGTVSGTVTVETAEFDVTATDQSISGKFMFDDFSNDGSLYLGGTVDLNLSSTIPDPANPTAGLSFSFSIDGDLAFSGAYKGRMTIDLNVDIGTGLPSISGSATVDGNTVSF